MENQNFSQPQRPNQVLNSPVRAETKPIVAIISIILAILFLFAPQYLNYKNGLDYKFDYEGIGYLVSMVVSFISIFIGVLSVLASGIKIKSKFFTIFVFIIIGIILSTISFYVGKNVTDSQTESRFNALKSDPKMGITVEHSYTANPYNIDRNKKIVKLKDPKYPETEKYSYEDDISQNSDLSVFNNKIITRSNDKNWIFVGAESSEQLSVNKIGAQESYSVSVNNERELYPYGVFSPDNKFFFFRASFSPTRRDNPGYSNPQYGMNSLWVRQYGVIDLENGSWEVYNESNVQDLINKYLSNAKNCNLTALLDKVPEIAENSCNY